MIDALSLGRAAGISFDRHAWSLQRALLDFLEKNWDQPDEGIWEVRGPRRHFVHSKVMAWVAFDRACHGDHPWPARPWRPLARDRRARSTPRCARRGTTRHAARSPSTTAPPSWTPPCCSSPRSGSCPRTTRGWCPPWRRSSGSWSPTAWCAATSSPAASRSVDGLSGSEGAFLACSFWLVNALQMIGHERRGARAVRPAARPPQRRRPAQRGVRPAVRPPGRQHAAGVQSRAADPGRPQPGRRTSPCTAAALPGARRAAAGSGQR